MDSTRAALLDELVNVLLSAKEGDSASDHRQRVWRGLRHLGPVLETTVLTAPSGGVVSEVEARAEQTVARGGWAIPCSPSTARLSWQGRWASSRRSS